MNCTLRCNQVDSLSKEESTWSEVGFTNDVRTINILAFTLAAKQKATVLLLINYYVVFSTLNIFTAYDMFSQYLVTLLGAQT